MQLANLEARRAGLRGNAELEVLMLEPRWQRPFLMRLAAIEGAADLDPRGLRSCPRM